MISNPGVVAAGFTRQVPIETVIIDEASQIEIGDYLPLINTFGNGIKKLAFIGDDRQCLWFIRSLYWGLPQPRIQWRLLVRTT